jgi:hypothetical protein
VLDGELTRLLSDEEVKQWAMKLLGEKSCDDDGGKDGSGTEQLDRNRTAEHVTQACVVLLWSSLPKSCLRWASNHAQAQTIPVEKTSMT